MKKENKRKNGNSEKNGLKTNHLFLIAMIILLVGIMGAGVLGHFMTKNTTISDNLSYPKINPGVNNESYPKEVYTPITIHGLNCYVKTKYTNFIHVTEETDYEGLDEYLELTEGKSVDFVDYNNFAQLFARDGKFRIEVSKSLESKGLMNYNEKTDSVKNITVNGNNVSVVNIKKFSDQSINEEEYTFAFFKVKDKYVEVGWAGKNIDMYIIESFFKLN